MTPLLRPNKIIMFHEGRRNLKIKFMVDEKLLNIPHKNKSFFFSISTIFASKIDLKHQVLRFYFMTPRVWMEWHLLNCPIVECIHRFTFECGVWVWGCIDWRQVIGSNMARKGSIQPILDWIKCKQINTTILQGNGWVFIWHTFHVSVVCSCL